MKYEMKPQEYRIWYILLITSLFLSLFALYEDYLILPRENLREGVIARLITILFILIYLFICHFKKNFFSKNRIIFVLLLPHLITVVISYLQILSNDISKGYYMGILQLQLITMFYITISDKEIWSISASTLAIYYISLWYDGVVTDPEYFSFTGLLACNVIFFLVSRSYRKNLDRLDVTLGQLQKAKDTEQIFFANASHELKTPIHSAYINLELLKQKFEQNPKKYHHDHALLQDVLEQMKKLKHLIQDVLDVTVNANQKLTLAPFETAQISQLITHAQKETHLEKKLNIIFKDTYHDFFICTDLFRFSQILHNILLNAYKYSPSGNKTLFVETLESTDFISLTFKNPIPSLREESFNQNANHGLGLIVMNSISSRLNFKCTYSSNFSVFNVWIAIPISNVGKQYETMRT